MFDLTGKRALITGASGGIGGGVAEALHAAGATVALSGTREAPLADLAAKLGDRAHVVTANLGDPAAVEALPKAAAEAMGGVDILVNNAGITRDNLFMRMSDEEWAQVIDVNLTASFRLMRGVLRGMMKARWGRIVNITSVVGATGNPGQGNYAAAKAGVVGMSKSLAYEVASRGITVNCVAPGAIATDFSGGVVRDNPQVAQAVANMTALGRPGLPEDIGPMIASLLSDDHRWVNAQRIEVSGGMRMALLNKSDFG